MRKVHHERNCSGVFAGCIVVDEAAVKTDAEMSSRNLLLSADAEIDSKPQLEIHTDDVKCSHGVTVGQLDAESVFYLQSRGIDETSARNMLTFAFANEMVEKFLALSDEAPSLGTLSTFVGRILLPLLWRYSYEHDC
jgi:Fe-S cluster assembly scaffold protein SufB